MTRRTRSAERPEALRTEGLGGLERLTGVLERLLINQGTQGPPAPRETFRAPEYDGNSDVEAFIRQFNDVAVANDWGPGSALLHIRERLRGQAKDCGHGQTIHGVFNNLRARFGLTPKEARAKLQGLKKDQQATLFEHATQIEKLTDIAFGEMSDRLKEEMAVDTFCGTLGNVYLQRHLLAVPTPTLEAAVRAGNEYLQVRPSIASHQAQPFRSDVRAVQPDETGQGEGGRGPEEPIVVARTTPNTLELLLTSVTDLAKEVAKLKLYIHRPQSTTESGTRKKEMARCWGCNQEGHQRRSCPRKQANQRTPYKQDQGNAYGPQQ